MRPFTLILLAAVIDATYAGIDGAYVTNEALITFEVHDFKGKFLPCIF